MPVDIFPSAVDASGNVFFTQYNATDGTSNDFWRHPVCVFNDTSTDLYAYGATEVEVPSGAASVAVYVHWSADNNVTSGKTKWGFSYRVLAADGSADQATAQESVSVAAGTTTSGTADGMNITSIGSLTFANLVAARTIEYRLERLGSDTTNDTMAARAVVHALNLRWA
jgi:hypothetical protein